MCCCSKYLLREAPSTGLRAHICSVQREWNPPPQQCVCLALTKVGHLIPVISEVLNGFKAGLQGVGEGLMVGCGWGWMAAVGCGGGVGCCFYVVGGVGGVEAFLLDRWETKSDKSQMELRPTGLTSSDWHTPTHTHKLFFHNFLQKWKLMFHLSLQPL